MHYPIYLSLFLIFFAFLQSTYAIPVIDTRFAIVERQSDAPFNGPVTVQTVNSSTTAAGLVTVTCTITLTPIVVNGQNLVQEVQDCATSVSPSDSNNNSATSDFTAPPLEATTTLASVPAEVTGTTTIAVVTPIFPATTTAAAAASIASANAPAGTADAANASQTTAFTLPGQKLQVLPIGLGVFAGISVIALIVVGLVTYERTKYRRAFRARKLAESGAEMGYSGTNP